MEEVDYLKERIEHVFLEKKVSFHPQKMFGGICYMVNDKMCVGVSQDKKTRAPRMMARVGTSFYEEALIKPNCEEFNITGRPLKGLVRLLPEAIDSNDALEFWIQKCLDYNPEAKKSKKK